MSKKPSDFNLDTIIASLPQSTERAGGSSKLQIIKSKSVTGKKADSLNEHYIEVPKANLSNFIGSYVRYKDSSGALKPGGGKIKSVGPSSVQLSNYNFTTKKYYVWTVEFHDISKIYRYVKNEDVKQSSSGQSSSGLSSGQSTTGQSSSGQTSSIQEVTAPLTAEEQMLNELGSKMLFNDNEMVLQKVDKLESDIRKIESDLKKLFMVVKKHIIERT